MSQLPRTMGLFHGTTIMLILSLVFNVAVIVFKKIKFGSGSRQNNLNELIVNNFLNLMTFTKIILFVCVALVFSVLHAMAEAKNAMKYMMMKAFVETIFQLYQFQSNPAFR